MFAHDVNEASVAATRSILVYIQEFSFAHRALVIGIDVKLLLCFIKKRVILCSRFFYGVSHVNAILLLRY